VNYTPPVELPKPVVTITNPTTNPFTTSNSSVTITATVLNISSKEDITFTTMGNTAITNFTYDANSKTVNFTYNNLMPSMPFTITAKNSAGSDSKSITVKYVKQEGSHNVTPVGGGKLEIGMGKKPVVTFLNPATSPSAVTNQSLAVRATVEYVDSKSGVKVKLNGNEVTDFTFDAASHLVTFTATLELGKLNNITISGTNTYGSDSKSVMITVNQ
jgi:hypothetical protein